MGLIKAAFGATGGILADQWKEFFRCEAIPGDVLVMKGQKVAGKRSSNTKGTDNIITTGSVILVADGQCILDESVIGVILQTEVRQIHHGGVGGAADPLFHGLGIVAELGAQLDECHVTGGIPMGDHVVHHIDDILASDFTYNTQTLQNVFGFLQMHRFALRHGRGLGNYILHLGHEQVLHTV